MELTLQFKKELNDFQGKIMDDWYSRASKRIGVSIQTDQQIQDHKESHTRTTPTNSYCQHWVKNDEQVKKCDRLDVELKEELNRKNSGVATKGLACRCHKGISNFVHKLNVYNTNWYIYYGQFILSPLYTSDKVISGKGKDNYNAISNDIVKSKLNELGFVYFSPTNNTYIKDNPITTKEELSTNFPKNTKNLDSKLEDIAVVDLFDFLLFKDFVEREFVRFLDNWHNKHDKNNSIIPAYADETKNPLEVLLTKFGSSLEVQRENKRNKHGNGFSDGTIKILGEIFDSLTKVKADTTLKIDNKMIVQINEFAELEDKGKMLTQEWLDKSLSITELLESILKK